jgi:hypothetical protein
MAIDMQNSTDQSTTSLLSGILDDIQKLVKQQVQITRKEVTDEIHSAAQAGIFFASGAAVLFFGALILGFGLVHLVHWASTPAGSGDPASIPLWACHAIVGGPLGLLGLVLTWLGYRKVTSINPLHNPATDALKENVKWAANPMR